MSVSILYKDAIHLNEATNLLQGSIYVKDRNGIYKNCNQFQAQLAGFENPEEIIGKTDYDLPWRKHAKKISAVDQRIMESGIPEEIEESGHLPDGSEIIMLSRKSPLLHKNGKIIGIMGISLDITERKKVEEREKALIAESAILKTQLAEEERLRQATLLLAGAIAHEMRTPLMGITAGVRQLKNLMPLIQKGLETDLSKSQKLQELQALPDDLNRITRGAFTVIDMLLMNLKINPFDTSFEKCHINSCIKEALDSYPFMDREKPYISWEVGSDFAFNGNNTLIKHILFNLLKNALFYVKRSKNPKIQIRTETSKNNNILRFKDTGPGIPEDILPHIFDRFFSKTDNGTGIGLAFCKLVMDGFGGNITCHTVLNEYTEFVLEFPKFY